MAPSPKVTDGQSRLGARPPPLGVPLLALALTPPLLDPYPPRRAVDDDGVEDDNEDEGSLSAARVVTRARPTAADDANAVAMPT